MINKTYKIINNKFSRFFKFVFFTRYLFGIFFVAIILFLNTPHFFNYKNKDQIIKNYLYKVHGINIKEFESIEYISLPTPHLQINNVISNLYLDDIEFNVISLKIYPKILSIYNYEDFNLRKIIIEKSNLNLDLKNFKLLSKNIFTSENKIIFNNLSLNIKEDKNNILSLKEIEFKNFGLRKNIILGEVFDQKFKINLDNELRNFRFKLLSSGIFAKLNIIENNKNSPTKGNIEGKVLGSNFKLNFLHEKSSIKINSFFFRDKSLSFDSVGSLQFLPYLNIKLETEIKDIDSKLITDLDIAKILNYKDLIKRINAENTIILKSKKFSKPQINFFNFKSNLAYGMLKTEKNLKFIDSTFFCKSDINLLEKFPVLNFNCSINSKDKKKLLKFFKITYKPKNEILNIFIIGNINILNNKINFDKIETDNYQATKEDLEFFKTTFENTLFNEDFNSIFNSSKLRKFILEIM